MVEVFKTNINTSAEAEEISLLLSQELASCKVRFDLEDCDRVLKVEASQINAEKVIGLLTGNGYQCELLE